MCIESYIFRRALHGFSCNSVVSRETCSVSSRVVGRTQKCSGTGLLLGIQLHICTRESKMRISQILSNMCECHLKKKIISCCIYVQDKTKERLSLMLMSHLHGANMSRMVCALQEVIDLTEELVGNKQLAAIAVDAGASASGTGSTEDAEPTQWSVGEPCLAPWSKDGQ